MTDQVEPASNPMAEPESKPETVEQEQPSEASEANDAIETKKCNSCGEEIDASFPFCPKCGKSADAENEAAPTDKAKPTIEGIAAKVRGKSNLKKLAIGGGIALVVAVFALLFATHVICFHDWKDADCTHAKKCTICSKTEGKPLGHEYSEATCVLPATCDRCGETNGKEKGHSVPEWTVDTEATCAVEGLRHGTCSVCNKVVKEQVDKLSSHTVTNWSVTKEATCSAEGSKSGTCDVCGEKKTESIAKKEHSAGSWQATGTPYISNGNVLYTKEAVKCTVCGTQIDSRSNETKLSMEQQNALNRAWDYLDYTAFSHSGLIKQLEFEGFSSASAKFAADYCGADWNEQAAKKAQDYLDYTSFSRSGLISQLKFEGFTQAQAEYGVKAVGY